MSRFRVGGVGILFLLACQSVFADDAQVQGNKKGDGVVSTFLNAYTDGSQSIADTPWPYTGDGASPELRKLPAPQNSPPFPYGEYQIGGTPTIGDHNEAPVYPLMKALSENTDFWKDSRTQVSGWVELGGNLSTSNKQPGNRFTNAPAAYDQIPNSIQLHQADIRITRLPDTYQTDHVDFGYRFDLIYGMDYRFTTMKGFWSDQLLEKNKKYGFDMPMAYVDTYIPGIAQGMNIRVGRFISLPDIEAQLAPDNYLFSHSLLYAYDPYTQVGVVDTLKLNNNWSVQLGLTAGNDTFPGTSGSKLSPLLCVQWISGSNADSIYGCANTINGANYAYNNINQWVATWSHRFSQTLNNQLEVWYMKENNVPVCSGQVGSDGPSTPFGCLNSSTLDPLRRYNTSEVAVVDYLNWQVSSKDSVSFRVEYMDDRQGQRTGTPARYWGEAIGWTHFFNQSVLIRPEINRYQASSPAFNGGLSRTQTMVAADLIVRF
ncbi:outer membrane beta-barrel protein [Ralstonia insidiosa]|uniref:Outer membrane beta-barrel protein n=1 Tax=Ralstonia insidiosa TaxID=190721 RepID=A0A848P1E7_9RALS|nr:outer membrane beta-barrel protein [Ralstonia insidiosa]NMV39359.1 outer membrane beta-barrel protein [Ralstonia insidiosa]